jgi:hypothetical protein
MIELTAHVGSFDPERIHTDVVNTADLMEEPRSLTRLLRMKMSQLHLHHLQPKSLVPNLCSMLRYTWLTGTVSRLLRSLVGNVMQMASLSVESTQTPSWIPEFLSSNSQMESKSIYSPRSTRKAISIDYLKTS